MFPTWVDFQVFGHAQSLQGIGHRHYSMANLALLYVCVSKVQQHREHGVDRDVELALAFVDIEYVNQIGKVLT